MNLVTTQLLIFVRDAMSPLKLSGSLLSNEEFELLKTSFINQSSAVHLSFYENLRPEQRFERKLILNQLVSISDQLNTYLFRSPASWKDHPQGSKIKPLYLSALNLLENLINELGSMDLSNFEDAKISDFGLAFKSMRLKEQYSKLKQHLSNFPIDARLKEMLYGSLSQYIRKKGLTTGDFNYLEKLITNLLNAHQITTKRLMELLIINDFSVPEFFLYCLEQWKNGLLELGGLHEQLEMVVMEIDSMNYLALTACLRRPGNVRPLHEELNRFLHEKQEVVNQLIVLRREFLRDQKEAEESTRFQINLPVAQFGLLIRLLLEKGVLMKENIGELFSFFAAHFYTPKTLYISSESLQKKSSDVEFSTALKLKALLIAMLNYLNANFNLSNYSV